MDIRLLPDMLVISLMLVHAIDCLRWLMVCKPTYIPLLLDKHRRPLLWSKAKRVSIALATVGLLLYLFALWRIAVTLAVFGLLGASGWLLLMLLSVGCIAVLLLRCAINPMVIANAMIFRQRPMQPNAQSTTQPESPR